MLFSIVEELLVNGTNSIGHSRHSYGHSLANTVSKLGHEISSLRTKVSENIIHGHLEIKEIFEEIVLNVSSAKMF